MDLKCPQCSFLINGDGEGRAMYDAHVASHSVPSVPEVEAEAEDIVLGEEVWNDAEPEETTLEG